MSGEACWDSRYEPDVDGIFAATSLSSWPDLIRPSNFLALASDPPLPVRKKLSRSLSRKFFPHCRRLIFLPNSPSFANKRPEIHSFA